MLAVAARNLTPPKCCRYSKPPTPTISSRARIISSTGHDAGAEKRKHCALLGLGVVATAAAILLQAGVVKASGKEASTEDQAVQELVAARPRSVPRSTGAPRATDGGPGGLDVLPELCGESAFGDLCWLETGGCWCDFFLTSSYGLDDHGLPNT